MLGADVAASAIQSSDPPRPLVSVAVTDAPAVTVVALTPIVGAGAIVNDSDGDVPPPGAGVNTDTWAAPAAARSLAGMAAVNRDSLTYVVARSAAFQRTTEFVAKLPPLTVSMNAAPPAVPDVGESDDSVGVGASTVTVGLVAARM